MQSIGNERANLYWEGKGGFSKPNSSASAQQRKSFIKDKYVKKLWADPAVGHPVELYHKAVQQGQNPAEYIKKHTGVTQENSQNLNKTQIASQFKKPEVAKLIIKEENHHTKGQTTQPGRKPSFNLLEFDKPPAGTPKDKKMVEGHGQAKLTKQPSLTELFNFDQTPPKPLHLHHAHSQPAKRSHDELNLLGSPVTHNHVSNTPPPIFNFSQPHQMHSHGINLGGSQSHPNPQNQAPQDKYAALNMAGMFQPRPGFNMGGHGNSFHSHHGHHHNSHYSSQQHHPWG
jgi:hypothetical protein